MASFNRIIMVGNLTRDPDYKQPSSNSGQPVCRLSLASSRQFRNKQTGASTQEVCYIDVDVWGVQADNCRQYLQKGRPVLVEGRLKLDTWEADGQTKRKHSIVADRVVFLGSNQAAESVSDDMMLGGSTATGQKRAADTSASKVRKSAASSDLFDDNASGEALFKDEAPFDDLPF